MLIVTPATLPVSEVDEVCILDGRDVLGLDLLYVVGYGLLRTLNTKSSDHDLDFREAVSSSVTSKAVRLPTTKDRIITDKTDFQLSVRCGGGT